MKNEIKKLSEMTSEELAVALCKMAQPIADIFGDPDVAEFFSQGVKLREESPSQMVYMTRLVALAAPVILGEKHRNDVFAILAAIKGVEVEAVRDQPGMQTVNEVVQILMTDTDMMTFFRPRSARNSKINPGSNIQVRSTTDGAVAGRPADDGSGA